VLYSSLPSLVEVISQSSALSCKPIDKQDMIFQRSKAVLDVLHGNAAGAYQQRSDGIKRGVNN
jgi:hypothetical protein